MASNKKNPLEDILGGLMKQMKKSGGRRSGRSSRWNRSRRGGRGRAEEPNKPLTDLDFGDDDDLN